MSLKLVQMPGHLPTVQQPLQSLLRGSAWQPAPLERWMLSSARVPRDSSICRVEPEKLSQKLPMMGWVSVCGGQLRGVSPSGAEPTQATAAGRGVLAALAPPAPAWLLPSFPSHFLSRSFLVAISHPKTRRSHQELLQSPTHSPARLALISVPRQRPH